MQAFLGVLLENRQQILIGHSDWNFQAFPLIDHPGPGFAESDIRLILLFVHCGISGNWDIEPDLLARMRFAG